MIIDLSRFVATERPHWEELDRLLKRAGEDVVQLSLADVQRLHHLYERTASDLARLNTFASEPELRGHLEALLARAYTEIHESRGRAHRLQPLEWFRVTFPQTFRRHLAAFWLSVWITIAGVIFGGGALAFDSGAKHVLMPFSHLQGSPSERVAQEEKAVNDRLAGHKTSFSAFLMTHNTKVSIFTLSLGMTWGLGTILMLFYNGISLGAVVVDYVMAGQTKFLAGWLLPHGSIEIPSILIAGQAGLILGRALIGWGGRQPLRVRMRAIVPDLFTLIGGVATLLVWAGIIEAFFSQYHEPVLPYAVKITFGLVQLVLLTLFLSRSGKEKSKASGGAAT